MAYLNVCPACGAQNRVPARHLPDTGGCGACRAAAPEVRELAKEMAGKALVLKVDTEAQPTLAGRYGIQSIPSFMVFRNGQPVFQQAGLAPRATMRRWLE